jgi:hypothetical protein
MSVQHVIMPIEPTANQVELIASPENDDELWVIPSNELGLIDLPSLRHLLPDDFAKARVVDFEPIAGSTSGAWVLSKAA